LLQRAGTFAEVGDSEAFGNTDDSLADFLHHTADRAAGFVGTGTLFVKCLTHATDWGEGTFDVADDYGEADFLRAPRKTVTTRDTPPTLNDAR
jgi:hypothetical protein